MPGSSGEQRVLGAIAAVYTSDGYEWVQQGDQVNRVDLYHHPEQSTYRIVSCAEDGTVLINSVLYPDCVYEQASKQFHQWTGEDDESHGLSFATSKDAEAFFTVVQNAIKDLITIENELQESAALEEQMEPEPLTRPLPSDTQKQRQALVSAEQLLDLPRPVPFKSNIKQLHSSAAAYWRVETLLELCHNAPTQQSVNLHEASQLIEIADFDQFCSVYSEFNVVDLWLYLEDASTLENVAKQGLQALGAQLARGVPLGMYRIRDPLCTAQPEHTMLLCKVALGRTLPMAAGAQLDETVQLPTGYHSLYIPANIEDTEAAVLSEDGTPAYFSDNYLVLNTNLVLPTHMVKFSYTDSVPKAESQTEAAGGKCWNCSAARAIVFDTVSNRPYCGNCASMKIQDQDPNTLISLDQMPAIVDCCTSCGTGMPLDRFCRLCGVAVCIDCKMSGRHQAKEHVFVSVEDSYQEMLAEVNELGSTIAPLAARLDEYEHGLENFMLDSLCQVDNFKQDHIAYLSHHLQVGQALQLRRFEVDRIVSDFDRLLEFHYYEQQMCPKVNFVAQWEHFHAMCTGIKQRVQNLQEAPDFNRFTMALTRKNQAIMGARRQVMYRQNVIDRLAERLRERGVLTEDDEQLIATLDGGAGLSKPSLELPSSDEAKFAAIQETRQLLETPQRHPESWGQSGQEEY